MFKHAVFVSLLLAAQWLNYPAPGVPRLLARSGNDGSLGIAESAARGVPMFTRITRDNVESLTRLGACDPAARTCPCSPPCYDRRPRDRRIARIAGGFGSSWALFRNGTFRF